jgi:hypothetical protein
MEDRRGACRVLVGRPEGKRAHGITMRIWEVNIKNGSPGNGMGRRGLDRSHFGSGQVAGSFECSNKPLGSIKCGEFLDYLQNQLASEEGLCCME